MEANIAVPAALIGDPVRSAMLMALWGDRALPATALAWAARLLIRLLELGWIVRGAEGRSIVVTPLAGKVSATCWVRNWKSRRPRS